MLHPLDYTKLYSTVLHYNRLNYTAPHTTDEYAVTELYHAVRKPYTIMPDCTTPSLPYRTVLHTGTLCSALRPRNPRRLYTRHMHSAVRHALCT